LLSQHITKILHVALANLLPGCLRICNVMWMLGGSLDVTKLVQHPLQLISDPRRYVSEPSRVKTDSLERTCPTMDLIWVHENRPQIQMIQMQSCGICDRLNLQGNKHNGMWESILPISSPIISDTMKVLKYSSLQSQQHINMSIKNTNRHVNK